MKRFFPAAFLCTVTNPHAFARYVQADRATRHAMHQVMDGRASFLRDHREGVSLSTLESTATHFAAATS
ncbi:hypothetical protein [Thalassococcus sp. S3]|uniref:hypothetical protein n=1 Tax=Thalassococcus sp. S3 TaxID=2017482 RepID=UPI0010240D72|nr:hypothetical protein [Thalassococcus sp. S3]QBF30859.1 hypothetical protein CFI11_06470 [Thalassococcus sp. S3]